MLSAQGERRDRSSVQRAARSVVSQFERGKRLTLPKHPTMLRQMSETAKTIGFLGGLTLMILGVLWVLSIISPSGPL